MTTTAVDDQYAPDRDAAIERLAMEVAPEEWAGMSTMHVGHHRITWGEYQLAREGLINKPSWDDAPEWAEWLAQDRDGSWCWFERQPDPEFGEWCVDTGKTAMCAETDTPGAMWEKTLERHPAFDEARADAIGQNGGDGLHYAEDSDNESALSQAMRESGISTFPKQARYQDARGEDWIDEFARTASPEEFRGAMRFTIGKYLRRAGKKDSLVSEITKIEDYARRWREYELARELDQ